MVLVFVSTMKAGVLETFENYFLNTCTCTIINVCLHRYFQKAETCYWNLNFSQITSLTTCSLIEELQTSEEFA